MADFFRPNLDIKESKKNYQVSVEMPGVDKNDIDITIDGGRLMIRGEKKKENTQEDENYHFVERSYGSFQRILDLPEDAETENLDASFKKGILTLKLNKKKTVESEARKIEIKT